MKLQIYENHLVLIADANMASTIGGGAGGTNNGGHFSGRELLRILITIPKLLQPSLIRRRRQLQRV